MSTFVERFKDEVADGYALGPVRVAVGALLGWDALTAAAELARVGYFGDAFHLAMIPESLVPSQSLYSLLLALRMCAAMTVIFGIRARPALAGSALVGVWLLLCDRLQFDHDRYSLFCYALLLSLTPCDRSWRAAEGPIPEPRTGPFWAVRLAQLQVSLVYLASGGSKLLDPDWRSGLVLADRVMRHAHLAPSGLSHRLADLVARPGAASALAKVAIMTELVICVAVWIRATRVVALWWGLWFHLSVALTANAEIYTLLTLAMYGLFATPDHRARTLRFDPSRPWGKLAGGLVPIFDWFGRFEVKPWEPDDQPGHSVVVIRRDGRRVTGMRAFAMVARCLPILFPFWAPLALVASFTRQGDLSTAT